MTGREARFENLVWVFFCVATAVAIHTTNLNRPRLTVNLPAAANITTYFHQSNCAKCAAAEKWVRAFSRRNPGTEIARFDMRWLDAIEKRREYDDTYSVPESHRLEVPALFAEGEAYIGVEAIRDFVEGKSKSKSSSLQRAADRYGPTVLRWLLATALIAVSFCAISTRGRNPIITAVRIFLGCVLLVSAASKGIRLETTFQSFGEQWPQLASSITSPLIIMLIAIEGFIGLALLLGRASSRLAGKIWALASRGSLALFASFLLYSVAAILFRITGDCGCFSWRENLGWNTFVRNLGFVVLSWSLLVLPSGKRPTEQCINTSVQST